MSDTASVECAARKPGAAPDTPVSLWRSAAGILGTRAIDLPCRYGFHLLVAWKLGLLPAGAFYIAFSFLTLAAGLGRLGVDRALTREVARARAEGRAAQSRAVIARGLSIIAGLSALSAAAMGLLAPVLADRLLGNPALARPILLGATTIIPLCLSAGIAGALAGLDRVSLSQMVYSWLWPGLFCLLAIAIPLTLDRAMMLIIVAMTLAALIAAVVLWRLLPHSPRRGEGGHAPHGGGNVRPGTSPPGRPEPIVPSTTPQAVPLPMPVRARALMALGWSLFTTEIIQLLMAALPALVLGATVSEAAVGAYALAWRVSLIFNLLVVAIAAMASPRYVAHSVRGDGRAMRQTAAQSVGLVLGAGLLPLIALAIGAPWILALFGRGFDSGTSVLRLLLLGQLVLMVTATTPELLGMTGHERAMSRANAWSIAIFVPALYGLSRWLGADGAALATVIVALINAGAASVLARKWLGFTPIGALLTRLGGQRRPVRAG